MRLNTGVFWPDDDWPGIFIRGDEVGNFIQAIRRAQSLLGDVDLSKMDKIDLTPMNTLAVLLGSCDAFNQPKSDRRIITGSQSVDFQPVYRLPK